MNKWKTTRKSKEYWDFWMKKILAITTFFILNNIVFLSWSSPGKELKRLIASSWMRCSGKEPLKMKRIVKLKWQKSHVNQLLKANLSKILSEHIFNDGFFFMQVKNMFGGGRIKYLLVFTHHMNPHVCL